MHPVIKVAGLAALAVGLATAELPPLILATILLMILAGVSRAVRPVFIDPPRRLKWLLLSVLGLYAFLLPGEPLVAGWERYSPSIAGVREGLLRCWMLLLMAGAARWLMAVTPREQIMGALYWIGRPLERLGLDSARFCLRLVLTLEYALTFRHQAPVARAYDENAGFARRAADLARARLRAAEQAAAQARPGPVDIPLCGAPPWWQWGGPVGLLIALLAFPEFV